ncbi:ATP-binding cassette domain-containing protein [Micromonospora sp. WMMD1076]|uniref:ABC transporter ATP-binding protein n=1 Tax=Micromonospora sp. WMMD1076 TaxID=3016103 RepID=UPI00249CD99D|nr:ATP-binding cassette domain-containing protein [Micromonospora sp. WMMD1076]WFF06596.1 ATP-binding cassette domain-containing protein [Micromonospora sp. WMMD1076]
MAATFRSLPCFLFRAVMCGKSADRPALESASHMLSCRSVAVSYASGRVVSKPLVKVDLEVAPGETVALMGPSGSGKSTLLRVLGGLQRPERGSVRIKGAPVRVGHGTVDPRVAFIHQDSRLVDFLSVHDNLRLALEVRGIAYAPDRVEEALAAVGLADKRGRMPQSLSGGERQRVSLARALVVAAPVVLADEPTGALDRANSEMVAELLRAVASRGDVCVVVATHDHHVARMMDRGVYLHDGQSMAAEMHA